MCTTNETEASSKGKKAVQKALSYVLNQSIVKSNRLIQAKYKGGVLEEKIVYAALYAAQNKCLIETQDGFEVLVSSNELREMINYKGGSFYEKLKPAAAALMQRVYGIEDPENDRFEYIHLINKCSYDRGEFKIVFGKEQKDLLMNLTSNFTQLPVLMMKLKNVYAFRLYELLKSECYYKKNVPQNMRDNVFKITHSISELKLALGVVDANTKEVRNILESKNPDFDKAVSKAKDSMYSINGNFTRDVIQKAIKEINEKLDMHVEFTNHKVGNQIHDVEFVVTLKEENRNNEPEEEITLSEAELFEFHSKVLNLFDNKLGYSEVPMISKKSGYNMDKLIAIRKIMDESRTEIGNMVGFIVKALDEGYKPSNDDEPDIVEVDPDILELAKKTLGKEFTEEDVMSVVIAANNDLVKIKSAKQILDKQNHVKNSVGFLISAIKREYREVESYGKAHRDRQGIMRDNVDYDEIVRQKVLEKIK